MEAGPRPPTVDEVTFRELYQKTEYAVDTADGWSLVITRYQPTRLPFFQPLWMEPLLLVHGFSQNRHAWTSGEFVKNLLYFGVDIHVLELRGHGKSSIARQRLLAERDGRPLPADLDYQWDVDSYLVEDVPAAVAAVKRMTGRPKIFYCGHSMGGMLGYGYAGQHDDLEGLITIGSASELGRGFPALRLLSMAEPALQHLVDAVLAGYNAERSRRHLTARLAAAARRRWNGTELSDGNVLAAGVGQDVALPVPIPTRLPYVPVDVALHAMDWILGEATRRRAWAHAARGFKWLSNPTRTERERIHWLLRNGGEREPRAVVAQFARWVRRTEMKCYRTGYDFRQGYEKIRIPMAIIFGDLDPLATIDSTRGVYRAAKSEFLLWRPVKGNSHIELTMGHDIRQICYDIKNLMEYARSHRTRQPSLPRVS